MGLWKGKKGSSVFYKIWNTNNKEVQGIREYQPNVRNPQTDYQADQRMKMLPAQLVKGALRDIVSRSFQGIPYGSKSRLEFLKYALKAETFPFLMKGITEPVPGEYLISRGTLQQVGGVFEDITFVTTLQYTTELNPETGRVAAISEELLAENTFLKEGDQLTFVGCIAESGNMESDFFNWHYWSMQIDTSSPDQLSDIAGSQYLQLGMYEDKLTMASFNDNLFAAGVIVSRKGEDGLYLRSNCRLTLNMSGSLAIWFDENTRASTRASYQTGQTRGYSDWPVQGGADDFNSAVIDGSYTLAGLTGDLAVLNGRLVKVRMRESSGTIIAVYTIEASGSPVLCTPSGDWLDYQVAGEVAYLTQAQVPALAGLPAIPYTANGRTLSAEPSAEEKPTETRKIAKKSAKKAD